jgi:hypothetical protein
MAKKKLRYKSVFSKNKKKYISVFLLMKKRIFCFCQFYKKLPYGLKPLKTGSFLKAIDRDRTFVVTAIADIIF